MLDTSKIYTSKNSGKFKIVKYNNAKEITVRFLSTGYSTTAQSSNIRTGNVKDYLIPNVCGIGYFGVGKYKSFIKGVKQRQYSVWHTMIERCYCERRLKQKPTYKDVTVCAEWHDFQVFAKWFDDHYIAGMHIDKDVKQQGINNKIYSPSTCLFITPTENSVEANAKIFKFNSPSGELVSVFNLSKFCRDNNLTLANLHKVYKEERVQHKGWTKA